MEKLKVFSKKIGGNIENPFGEVDFDKCYSGWMNNGWNNTGQGWVNQGWTNGGGCYLTTACVEHKGLADDCSQLESLRKFRDTIVQEDDVLRGKILEYYRTAPIIVQQINQSENSIEVYNNMFDEMITPCVQSFEAGNVELAKEIYLDFYHKLLDEYLTA